MGKAIEQAAHGHKENSVAEWITSNASAAYDESEKFISNHKIICGAAAAGVSLAVLYKTNGIAGITEKILPEAKDFLESRTARKVSQDLAHSLEIDARSSRIATRLQVAENKNSSPDLLSFMSEDANPLVRKVVASNPFTPAETIQTLLSDDNQEVKWAAARAAREGTTARGQLDFVKSGDPLPGTLARIAADGGTDLKLAIAKHTNADATTLRALADNPDAYVRADVAAHPAASPRTLVALSGDDNYFVRRAAAGNPRLPSSEIPRLAADEPGIRERVAMHPRTSRSLLRTLMEDHDYNVRAAVAGNSHTSAPMLDKLATDSGDQVRLNVALNHNVSDDALEKLKKDPVSVISEASKKTSADHQALYRAM